MNNTQKAKYITSWISAYVENMAKPAESLIIGISGGIDSSLTSTLAASTGLKTIVVTMPINSNPAHLKLSLDHGAWLLQKFNNVQHNIIDLSKIFNTFEDALSGHHSDLGLANSKARLRMTTLYQVAASNNGIVVGTGNKVEDFGVGFYTKYGDGGVDISPIADLMKSDVRELSKEIGILDSIVKAPPTDGLWEDSRTDEMQLGLTYDEIEEAMLNENSINRNLYLELRKSNLHKMKEIPVCILPKGKS